MKTTNDILAIHLPKPRYPILPVMKKRWSPRFYAPTDIPVDDIKRMVEAARFAPSAYNHQPWYFYYAKKGQTPYEKLFSTLNTYNQSWAKTAPVLLLACVITKNEHGENPFALYDLGAAVISLVYEAQFMGYYCRQMGLFDKTNVKRLFHLKPDHEPFIVIAVGKIGDYRKAPKEIVDRELDLRPRKSDLVHPL